MIQSELDEISLAFLDAWKEFFGQEMFFIPFLINETIVHRVYKESKGKKYDVDNKLSFTGTFKESTKEELGELFGQDTKAEAEVTFVTSELFDKGIKEVELSSRIEIAHRSGKIKLYDIVNVVTKVQLGTNRIFTKLGVLELE